ITLGIFCQQQISLQPRLKTLRQTVDPLGAATERNPNCAQLRWYCRAGSGENNHPPRPHRMFHNFVGTSDLCKWQSFPNLEAGPPCLKRRIQIARGLYLCCLREIVAAQKKQTNVLKYHLPEGNLRRGVVGSIARDGSAQLQEFDVSVDIGS